MEKPLDLRIQKTHMALSNAFIKLLGTKKYEEITINELCDTAMVRRATFYKHFGDKNEFFSFMIREMIAKYRKMFLNSNTDCSRPQDFYIHVVEGVLCLLSENRELVQSLSKSQMLPTLTAMIEEEIRWGVQAHIVEDEKKGIRLPAHPAGLMASIFTGALMSMGIWWIEQKEPVSKETLIQELSECILKL